MSAPKRIEAPISAPIAEDLRLQLEEVRAGWAARGQSWMVSDSRRAASQLVDVFEGVIAKLAELERAVDELARAPSSSGV